MSCYWWREKKVRVGVWELWFEIYIYIIICVLVWLPFDSHPRTHPRTHLHLGDPAVEAQLHGGDGHGLQLVDVVELEGGGGVYLEGWVSERKVPGCMMHGLQLVKCCRTGRGSHRIMVYMYVCESAC